MELRKRKPTRLKHYDYSRDGYYYITICTAKRKNIFSEIVGQGLAPAEIKLTQTGRIAEEQLINLEKRYNDIKIEKYVIMPNHIHIILKLTNAQITGPCNTDCARDKKAAVAGPCPTVSGIICAYKSLTRKKCKEFYDEEIWQKSFYDHIIRDEDDYLRVWNYIESNPGKWTEDKYYID